MKLYEILNGDKEEYMFPCIYLWVNLIDNKKYVGQAQNFYKRMYDYKVKRANKHLLNAIDKYGIDNFNIYVLEKIKDIKDLNEREQYWMDYYRCYEQDKGYNICRFASTTRGYHHTEETHKLLSKIRKENPVSLKGENNPMYGKHHTEETKKKISDANKGKYYGKTVKVICVETKQIFESISQAAKFFNSNINGIYVALDKENRTCKGYHFKRLV